MRKKASKLKEAILETASDLLASGLISENDYVKITMHHVKKNELPEIEPMTSEDIKAIREKEHLSQAVFARFLNVTVGYISKLERGLKEPTGAVLALLNVIRRKGLNALFR